MYIRKTGYVTRENCVGTSYGSYSSYDYDVSDDNYADKRHSGRVEKMGRVLTLREERAQEIRKNTDLENMVRQGVPYYSVSSNENACEKCQKHNGAIYPVSQAKIEENFPPFHPNCKCRVTAFSTSNIHDDPGLAEIIFWLEIMYGGLSIEEQVREYLDFYGESEFSEEFIARVLSSTANITNISERIEVFFERLPNKTSFMNEWHGQYIGADGYEGIIITDEFKEKVWSIAIKNGINPNDLMTLMAVESKISTQLSPYHGQAAGLIQFANYNNFGYTIEEVGRMDEFQQLELVDLYFQNLLGSYPAADPQNIIDLYTLMFLPGAGGYGESDAFIIASKDRFANAYANNPGLDEDGDGAITRGDLRQHIESSMNDYSSNIRR